MPRSTLMTILVAAFWLCVIMTLFFALSPRGNIPGVNDKTHQMLAFACLTCLACAPFSFAPLNYCVLRYFNVASADLEALTGQSTAGATHLIKVAVEAALGKRASVGVFGTDYAKPDGTGVRDYIHASDLAEAQVLALEALVASPSESLTLNCGCGRGFSLLDVLDAVDRVNSRKIVHELQGRRAGDPDSLIPDNRRIKARLPWVPRYYDLDTTGAHALAWERKLGEIRVQ